MNAIAVATLGLAIIAGNTGGADDLRAAKDLYAAANYEEALSTLDRLDGANATTIDREVGQYRLFCLYALGRTKEAESVAEALIRADALVQLDARETSPRIQAMFDAVRKRLLPTLIQDEYRLAKAARADKNAAAEPHFIAARGMLDEARKIDVWSEKLADLEVLVDGFLDLGRAAEKRGAATLSPVVAVTPDVAPPLGAAPSRVQPRQFDSSDTDVTPPVAIRQSIPRPSAQLMTVLRASGKNPIIDVLIDETGAVEHVALRAPVNPLYDRIILKAAQGWKYRPAMKNGTPAKYFKTVAVALSASK